MKGMEFVAIHPCIAPIARPVADQKHSQCFCLEKSGKTGWTNIANAIVGYGLSDFVQAVQPVFSENHSGTNCIFLSFVFS